MKNHFELYVLFQEKMIEDLQSEITVLKSKVELLEYQVKYPVFPLTEIPETKPWESKWGNINACPKCGLRLDQGPMSYSCPNLECPTGLGPVYCKA